jgi:hypothetical protein
VRQQPLKIRPAAPGEGEKKAFERNRRPPRADFGDKPARKPAGKPTGKPAGKFAGKREKR